MPSYTLTARVVLHKDDKRTKEHSPDAEEYATLHAEMHSRDYRRYYIANNGKMYKLPPGEYNIDLTADDGAKARDAALKKVQEAATLATSANRYSALVTGGGGLLSANLEIITKDPDA
ncbi:hypothetical protein [Burkholderia sp. NRF60-BP8]|uniref:hypothetical protein n=1 Tax=Burkholderia sp. NRF60-BP8 TaxID=1637853 RepID=UPI00075C166B|nr:hypothetical protein [Burkholderia sp. NRF60-BP8]AOI78035.1 hypothetical protein WS54_16975 [Burkholderia sp. NRF60-BP8]KVA18064.1 hypothetical protein WS54_05650 [Burkholderia sp. NRF60-BP8]